MDTQKINKNANRLNLFIALGLALMFFIFGLITLPDYGINWDTINHLPRGQAYLRYFLTGKKDYSDLLPQKIYWQDPNSLVIKTDLPKGEVPTRSIYQSDLADFKYFINNDGNGHPPLSDILSSIFNRVLFGRLHLINDIDAYRVYGLSLAALLVGLVYFWVAKLYGKFAGLVSSTSLALYPLFWAESHFNNEKDIPETVFWTLFIYCIWKGITEKKYRFIAISGIFFGLALGTKFNILFSALIVLPWVTVYFLKNGWLKVSQTLKLVLTSFTAIVVGITILVATWPYVWADPLTRLGSVFGFYKGLGLEVNPNLNFVKFGINLYPAVWIALTTQPLILLFAIIGIGYLISQLRKNKSGEPALFLLMLTIPILRVTWGGSTIYGGVRQIMEYIPAMAIIAGIGANFLVTKFKVKSLINKVLIVLLFIIIVGTPLVKSHPVENTYFNFLTGGLNGARKNNLPAWGNTYGSAYRQGIAWLNDHAEQNAKLVLSYELNPNLPDLWVRGDISFNNEQRSGYLKQGEYAMTLNYQGTEVRDYYDMYLRKYLRPVYEVKNDGVPVLIIWKNDADHLYQLWSEKRVEGVKVYKKPNEVLFEMPKPVKLLRLDINYSESRSCSLLKSGYFEYSLDNKVWLGFPNKELPGDRRITALGVQPRNGTFIEPFVGQEAKYLRFKIFPDNSCLKNFRTFGLYSE